MARNSIAPGGYIGGEPPRRPTFNQLSGVWKLDDVLERQKNNTWSNPLGVEDVFSTWLYTGNGSTQTITNGIDLAGKGGLVWTKGRSTSINHAWYDTARGGSAWISSSSTLPQLTYNDITFGNTGYSVTNSSATTNVSGVTYASWTFRKAAKFFDVVTYTGTSVARTVAHNLGSVPGCIIVKRTDAGGTGWFVYHRSLGATKIMVLNETTAETTISSVWNNTEPTSSNFTLGDLSGINLNGATYVAYLFAHDAGGFGDSGNESVIKCGSFTTDGSGNATVNLGWEPQWLLVKQSAAASDWLLIDTMRGASHSGVYPLSANLSAAENPSTGAPYWVPTPTGFSTTAYWASATAIYVAIRRGPMKAPTDAAKVFSANFGTGSSTVPTFQTGFPVDLGLFRNDRTTNGISILSASRLSGSYLQTASTSAETANPVAFTMASNTGWGTTYDSTRITWNFRRSPGFFDVVAYTGTGSARTVAHNLGVAPELIISKNRAISQTWFVYSAHISFGNALALNDSSPASAYNIWSSAPSSSLIYLTDDPNGNRSGDNYIAYLFASCPGVSKVGSYTGTGTTLNIDCGFTNGARFVLIKRINGTSDWYVWDSARGIVSGNDPYLLLNSTAAEVTNTDFIDPLSTGFQISSTAPAAINVSGGTFLFFAIA